MNLSPQTEGAGNAGRSLRPQPRVRKIKSTTSKSPRSHRFHPAFPARLVLTGSFVLSPVIGLVCHRRRPRCRSIVTHLMPASRHQDHTTSPSASHAFVLSREKRPPHPVPNVL